MNQLDMQGRKAVVTGGASGIGFTVAQRLVLSGAAVSLWDRDQQALEWAAAKLGTPCHVQRLDVSEAEQVEAAGRETNKALGRIDILVASAGIAGPNTVTWEYPIEAWKQILDVNLTGLFLCNRALIPYMLSNDYGRIVNISSIAGKEGNPTACAYSASKAGVISLTKSLGKELAKTGIRVNCITPATVQTEMLSQVAQSHIDYMRSKIPMGRFGQPEEIAAMVAWLCTEECSFTTGAVFDLSGGRAVY
jgi:2-dehydro-3-deoxy-L-rhamnonate dehydrogenase (NAD+)